ncbi:MAG: response regulator transcription factor [Bacteroidetes bacterium]|nr:response regulator transcription factor [Bacteroidota bacterium]
MKNLKVLIVDDEVLIAEDLKDILKSFGIQNIHLAHSKTEALTALNEIRPHLALLDIRMENELDGLELGQYIIDTLKIPFIYITAHSDMVMIEKIVKTKPSAYITKPFKKSDLFASINLIRESLSENQAAVLNIKDGYNTVILPFDTILYIEGEGNYINIYSESKKIVSRQSLDSVYDLLDTRKFFRIHRSYIVNTQKITKYSKKEVELNSIKLPVSRNIAEEFENFMKQLS